MLFLATVTTLPVIESKIKANPARAVEPSAAIVFVSSAITSPRDFEIPSLLPRIVSLLSWYITPPPETSSFSKSLTSNEL